MLTVAVHDEPGDSVGLSVEGSVGVAIYLEAVAVGEGLFYAPAEPGPIHWLLAADDNAEGYLAARGVKSVAERISFAVEDGH